MTADQASQASGLGSRTEYLSILLIVVVLLAVFRSPLATVATLLPAVLVLLTAESVVAEVASLGIGVSSITQLLLIVLVLGAGTDYGLFLVFRVREERRRGLGHHEAIERSVERVGESIVFSAATVIAALLSLLLATFGVYHGLAIPLAIGIALMVAGRAHAGAGRAGHLRPGAVLAGPADRRASGPAAPGVGWPAGWPAARWPRCSSA